MIPVSVLNWLPMRLHLHYVESLSIISFYHFLLDTTVNPHNLRMLIQIPESIRPGKVIVPEMLIHSSDKQEVLRGVERPSMVREIYFVSNAMKPERFGVPVDVGSYMLSQRRVVVLSPCTLEAAKVITSTSRPRGKVRGGRVFET